MRHGEDNREDNSVTIGDDAKISSSAIGPGARVRIGDRRTLGLWLVGIVGTILVGWFTNYFYDWTAYVLHFFGRK